MSSRIWLVLVLALALGHSCRAHADTVSTDEEDDLTQMIDQLEGISESTQAEAAEMRFQEAPGQSQSQSRPGQSQSRQSASQQQQPAPAVRQQQPPQQQQPAPALRPQQQQPAPVVRQQQPQQQPDVRRAPPQQQQPRKPQQQPQQKNKGKKLSKKAKKGVRRALARLGTTARNLKRLAQRLLKSKSKSQQRLQSQVKRLRRQQLLEEKKHRQALKQIRQALKAARAQNKQLHAQQEKLNKQARQLKRQQQAVVDQATKKLEARLRPKIKAAKLAAQEMKKEIRAEIKLMREQAEKARHQRAANHRMKFRQVKQQQRLLRRDLEQAQDKIKRSHVKDVVAKAQQVVLDKVRKVQEQTAADVQQARGAVTKQVNDVKKQQQTTIQQIAKQAADARKVAQVALEQATKPQSVSQYVAQVVKDANSVQQLQNSVQKAQQLFQQRYGPRWQMAWKMTAPTLLRGATSVEELVKGGYDPSDDTVASENEKMLKIVTDYLHAANWAQAEDLDPAKSFVAQNWAPGAPPMVAFNAQSLGVPKEKFEKTISNILGSQLFNLQTANIVTEALGEEYNAGRLGEEGEAGAAPGYKPLYRMAISKTGDDDYTLGFYAQQVPAWSDGTPVPVNDWMGPNTGLRPGADTPLGVEPAEKTKQIDDYLYQLISGTSGSSEAEAEAPQQQQQ